MSLIVVWERQVKFHPAKVPSLPDLEEWESSVSNSLHLQFVLESISANVICLLNFLLQKHSSAWP